MAVESFDLAILCFVRSSICSQFWVVLTDSLVRRQPASSAPWLERQAIFRHVHIPSVRSTEIDGGLEKVHNHSPTVAMLSMKGRQLSGSHDNRRLISLRVILPSSISNSPS